MTIPELKSRIRSIDAHRLSSAIASHGDAIRGWWACVAAEGAVHVERDPRLPGLDAGVARADVLADEAVGAVVLSTSTTLNDDVRAIVGLLCGRDATQITPAAPSDHDWMTQCARLRDVQAALRDRISDAPDLIDAQSAGLVGLLLGLAARGTPCVFVGAAAHAAAVVAQRQSLAAAGWWRSGYCSSDPIDGVACERLQFKPWWSGRTEVGVDVLESLLVGTISSLRSSL
jgi:hypothetical protein